MTLTIGEGRRSHAVGVVGCCRPAALAGAAHHADDLLHARRIGRVLQPLVARRPPLCVSRHSRRRASPASSIQHHRLHGSSVLRGSSQSSCSSDGLWQRKVQRGQYLDAVLIAVLLVSETTIEKLADHHITPEEVRQVSDGARIVIRNPRPRVAGSVLMIGPTHGGRVLTVVLNPDPVDDGAWHVRTAWQASPAQINRYRRDR